jgi:fatty acid desaturase
VTRPQIHRLNHAIILVLAAVCLGSYFWIPSNPIEIAADILLRAYAMFLCTVMAHEGSHGHLGSTRRQNDWWGRLALLGPMVPYVSFRKTHRMHHARTNEVDDPDLFIKPASWWEVPLRSLAIPHYWLVWLKRRGWLTREDRIELAFTYAAYISIYTAIGLYVGPARWLMGAVPALILVSLLLWYPFAVRTHEGFSLGTAEERSHNYYGHVAFWFSLGLSMHRAHHMHPRLAWIQLLPHVERAPGWLPLPFRRDVRTS